MVTVDVNIQNYKQSNLTTTDYVLQLWTKTLKYGSVYIEKILKELFVKNMPHSIHMAPRQW